MKGDNHMLCCFASWGSLFLHRDWMTLIGCLAVVHVMMSLTPVAYKACQGKLADLGLHPAVTLILKVCFQKAIPQLFGASLSEPRIQE